MSARDDNALLTAAQEYCDRIEREQWHVRFLENALSVGAFLALVALLFLALHLGAI